MALLAADPKSRKQQVALVGLVIALSWYAVFNYVLSPKAELVTTRQGELEQLELKNRRARVIAAQKDALAKRMEVFDRQLRIFEEFIPQSEEVPELLDAISREAQLTGVELSRIRPRAPTAGDQFYTRQTWELAIVGDYHNIGRYLARIASLPRIIKPTSLQMGQAPRSRATRDMEAPLQVSFVAETYVLGALQDTTAAD